MNKTWLITLIILLNSSLVWSKTLDIVVVGLFKNQAVVEINKKQRLLKIGKASPEGVTLISANSRGAILEVEGVHKNYQLGSHIGTIYKQPVEQPTVNIWPVNNQYLVPGSINGYSVEFLVDTGATDIALNKDTARRLGLNYLDGYKLWVRTASDVVPGYGVILDTVQVGDITLHNIPAIVSTGTSSNTILLGMSFLGQLDIHQVGAKMELKKKF